MKSTRNFKNLNFELWVRIRISNLTKRRQFENCGVSGRFSIEGFFISILTNMLLHYTMLARETDMKNYELLFINEEKMNTAILNELTQNPNEAPYSLKALGSSRLYALEQGIKNIIYLFSLKKTKKLQLETAIKLFNLSSKAIPGADCEIKLIYNPIPTSEYKKMGVDREIYELIIKMGGKKYTVGKMTDCIYSIKNIMPEIESEERKDKCHIFSLNFADFMAKKGVSLNLVTGYVYHLTDQTKFLHSWVESKKGTVFDATLNAFIDKELYQKLYHYEEVSRFSGKTVFQDYKKLTERFDSLGEELDIKEFLVFGDEILREMKSVENNFQI